MSGKVCLEKLIVQHCSLLSNSCVIITAPVVDALSKQSQDLVVDAAALFIYIFKSYLVYIIVDPLVLLN